MNSSKKTRLVIILVFILLLLVLEFYLFSAKLIVPSAQVAGPSLSLAPALKQVNLDETFNVDILINTDSQNVASVDIFHLNFDPQFFAISDADSGVEGTQIQAGSIFPVIYQNNVDTNTGQIAFNAGKNIDGSGSFNGNGVLATIALRALKEGTTNVTFDFTPGQTNDCNIVLDTADGFPPDILAGVENGTFTIGNPITPTPTPSATVSTGSGTVTKHTSRPTSSPTATPTQEQTQAEPIVEESAQEAPIGSQNTSTSTPIAGLASPLSSPNSSPRYSSAPTKTTSPNPTSSPTETKLAGSSMGLMVNLLFYIGAPVLIILISYLIWVQVKRRRGEKSSEDNDEFNVW